MEATAIEQINKKLEAIPSDFYQEIMDYLSFISYKTDQKNSKKHIEEIQNSLHQVKKIKEGKLPKITAKDFLNEL